MSKPKTTIAEQLNAAQLAIYNSQADVEIQALVQALGYSAARLDEGCELYERAQAALNAQKRAAGAQQDATQSVQEAHTAALDAYQALAKVARAICDHAHLTALGLVGRRPESTGGFLVAAYTLFDNAAQLGALSEFGYSPEKLAAERARITAYKEADQRQEAAKGAAQQATQEQQACLQALNEWTAQYLKVARVALRGKPQLLEKLGIVVRTGKTPSST